jgi:hypothetical protein
VVGRLHDVVDAAWRAIERVHDLVGQLRAHHLFPGRKVFYGGCVTALGYAARPLLAKTGIDVGPYVPAAAGFITAYLFTDGPAVKPLDADDHVEA